MKKERIWQTSYEKAPILESLFKTEHLESYCFIEKRLYQKVFYYELYKVLIVADICVEHPCKRVYIRKIRELIHA